MTTLPHPRERVQDGWAHPRDPAPGRLRVVQMFANSDDLELGTDELRTPASTQRWLHEAGLLGAGERVRERDRQDAVELRDALRALLLANHDRVPADEPEARAVLDRLARQARIEVQFTGPGQAELVSRAGGFTGALGTVIAVVFESMRDGTWARMKACRSDRCHWAFYDHSRNRSGAWCQMESCGTEAKMRTYRQRQARGRTR